MHTSQLPFLSQPYHQLPRLAGDVHLLLGLKAHLSQPVALKMQTGRLAVIQKLPAARRMSAADIAHSVPAGCGCDGLWPPLPL